MSDHGPRFPNKFLVIGTVFTLVGGLLLLWTFGYLNKLLAAWPIVPLAAGLVLLYFRLFRNGPDHYVFFGTTLALGGLLFLLVTTAVPAALGQIWPLFMTVVGVSLFVYGLRKKGTVRITFTIPGAAIVILSLVFLPFSLELIGTEFVLFVSTWWPTLFLAIGIALIVSHFVRRSRPGDPDQDESDESPGVG